MRCKMKSKILSNLRIIAVIFILSQNIAANEIKKTACSVIVELWNALSSIGAALVTLMFLYGGLQYVYSADNPGGRKKGRDICVHALIGGVLIVLVSAIDTMLSSAGGTWTHCAGVAP